MSKIELVKQRMAEMRDRIDSAEEREKDAKNHIREINEKIAILGGEKTTLESRIKVVQTEYDKKLERLEESKNKLDLALARADESEVRRKELADTEVDDFERHEDVESTLKAAAVSKEKADLAVVESKSKELILKGDLERTCEKYDRFTKRVEELKEQLDDCSKQMQTLEEKDRDASERENMSEEKVKFLETQLREALQTAETHERSVGKLERLKEKLNDDISDFKEKHDEIRHEMEEAMGGLLDDD